MYKGNIEGKRNRKSSIVNFQRATRKSQKSKRMRESRSKKKNAVC